MPQEVCALGAPQSAPSELYSSAAIGGVPMNIPSVIPSYSYSASAGAVGTKPGAGALSCASSFLRLRGSLECPRGVRLSGAGENRINRPCQRKGQRRKQAGKQPPTPTPGKQTQGRVHVPSEVGMASANRGELVSGFALAMKSRAHAGSTADPAAWAHLCATRL